MIDDQPCDENDQPNDKSRGCEIIVAIVAAEAAKVCAIDEAIYKVEAYSREHDDHRDLLAVSFSTQRIDDTTVYIVRRPETPEKKARMRFDQSTCEKEDRQEYQRR